MMKRIREESKDERVRVFVEYAEKEGMYFKSPDEIRAVLGQYGLNVSEVKDRKDMWPETSRWWFVTGTKEV
jgi:hypothetical protein